jgi:hypothetical protein
MKSVPLAPAFALLFAFATFTNAQEKLENKPSEKSL